MSWETVTTVIRSNQLQQVCCEYQSTLAEYERAKESGDKERERHLKSQLASLKQKCPAIMPQAIVEGRKGADDITRFLPFMIVDLDHIPAESMAMVENIVKNSEYARLAYRTISGRGLRVIVKVDGLEKPRGVMMKSDKKCTTVIFVNDMAQAKKAAVKLVAMRVSYIELCSWFNDERTDAVTEATGRSIPIGSCGI